MGNITIFDKGSQGEILKKAACRRKFLHLTYKRKLAPSFDILSQGHIIDS